MLILAVDVGNTTIHMGLFRGKRLVAESRFPTARARGEGAVSRMLKRVTGSQGSGFPSGYACVVPRVGRMVRRVLRRLTGRVPLAVTHRSPLGISVRYRPASSVGPDRLAAAAGAVARLGAPVIVADFGTAVTVDAVSRRREFLGGAIAPGVRLCAEALAGGTALLPRSVPRRPPAIGRTTRECLSAGIVAGLAGLADGLADRMARRLGGKVRMVATGGGAGTVAPLTRRFRRIEPGLVLDGVRTAVESSLRGGER